MFMYAMDRIMIIVEMEIIGQEDGRIGAPVDVTTATGLAPDLKPKMNAPAPYNGAGAPGVPAYKGGAAKMETGSTSHTAVAGGNVNVFPINMLNPYQNKCVFHVLVAI